jgi:dTDP-glucose pyrophosphorylase
MTVIALEQGMQTGRGFAGVILAGGRGTRMFPMSDRYPKPLLPVGNRPLIVHQLELMRTVGISDVFILIGHRGFEIPLALGDGSRFGLNIRYVEQTEVLGIAHAVGRMEPVVDRPFLLFLGDIYFVPGDLAAMLRAFERQGGGAVLAVKDEPDPAAVRKNYAVVQDELGNVVRVIEKPRASTNRMKGVGLYLFDLTVFDAIRRTPRTAMRDEYEITDTIQVMIDLGLTVRVEESVLDDVNVTMPVDLLECNLLELRRHPQGILVAPDARVHPGARLERCVVGANAWIKHPIVLRDTLVFPDTVVEANATFDRFILTPDAVLDCGYGRAAVSRAR